jgi:hypothetical protein
MSKSRLFKFTSKGTEGELVNVFDLDKICRVRAVESGSGSRIKIWFVGGQEVDEPAPPELVKKFLEVFENYLHQH